MLGLLSNYTVHYRVKFHIEICLQAVTHQQRDGAYTSRFVMRDGRDHGVIFVTSSHNRDGIVTAVAILQIFEVSYKSIVSELMI